MGKQSRFRKKNKIWDKCVIFGVFVFAAGGIFLFPAKAQAAGIVTDTLNVMVGYWGMDTESFVEKGSYTWQELRDDLALHEVAYSFYRDGSSSLSSSGTYGTVIDSAYGFYIEDLMYYAGISLRDIQSIQFYTADVDIGYFTSFTYSELFETERYFFNDLASYFTVVYQNENDSAAQEDADGNIIYHEDDDRKIKEVVLDANAWNDKTVVKPMLALEDSWVTYELPTEGTAPDFTAMGTGNRFRLLFGQTSPTEQRTNQTAKYVHTLYVMLNGTPKLTEDNVELSNEIGSHSVVYNVAADDEALIQELIDQLEWTSSDDTVLKITDINMEESQLYNDSIQVTINYDILKEGEAAINGSFAGLDVAGTVAVKQPDAGAQNPSDEKEDGTGNDRDGEKDGSEHSSDGNGGGSENKGKKQAAKNGKTDENNGADGGTRQAKDAENTNAVLAAGVGNYGFSNAASVREEAAQAAGENAADQTSSEEDAAEETELEAKLAETLGDTAAEGGVSVYALDEQVAELLAQKQEEETYEQLAIKEREEKNFAPYLSVGAAALLAFGAGTGYAGFRKKL